MAVGSYYKVGDFGFAVFAGLHCNSNGKVHKYDAEDHHLVGYFLPEVSSNLLKPPNSIAMPSGVCPASMRACTSFWAKVKDAGDDCPVSASPSFSESESLLKGPCKEIRLMSL